MKISKFKSSRRYGLALWDSFSRSPSFRTELPKYKINKTVGQHGVRISDGKSHLRGGESSSKDLRFFLDYKRIAHKKKARIELQHFKSFYINIKKKQWKRLLQQHNSIVDLVETLESRLDVLAYRLELAPTLFAARQVVNHGHIRVNGKKQRSSSYLVRPGDIMQSELIQEREEYLGFLYNTMVEYNFPIKSAIRLPFKIENWYLHHIPSHPTFSPEGLHRFQRTLKYKF